VTEQPLPSPQAPQTPPQSVSVSSWLRTPSEQPATVHFPPVQTPLLQSASVMQPAWGGQGRQVGPPQSLASSGPFFAPSVQVGIWPLPPAPMPPPVQSLLAVHFLP